jgi:putative ABC transport system permease protein
MSLLALCLAYLRHRLGTTLLNLSLLALGVATITVLLLLDRHLREEVNREVRGIDLVVGAKGSPLQLILSTVFHLDVPTGNIPTSEAEAIRRHPLVARAVPLAMGDTAGGYRIVGTEPALIEERGARLAAGRVWQAPMEAVLGAEVARATGLGIGGSFVGAHGLGAGGFMHAEHAYEIVGVLAATGGVIDRLILTSVASVWKVHAVHRPTGAGTAPGATVAGAPAGGPSHPHPAEGGHAEEEVEGDEITALLIRYRSPIAAVQLPRLINARPQLQAASPALEAARLMAIAGVGLDALRLFGVLLVAAAGLSVFVALTNALADRRADLALMRVLGAGRGLLVRQLLLEALLLTGAGWALGFLLGHAVVEALARIFPQAQAAGVSGIALAPGELFLLPATLGLGVAAALVPAIRAYRTDLALVLARS